MTNAADPSGEKPTAERRLAVRVPVEESVWVRVGWRPMRATLLELSLTGARLVLPCALAPEDRLTVWLPSRFEGIAGRPLPRTLRGRIAWSDDAADDGGRLHHAGLAVDRYGFGARRRLELALRRFQARFDRRGSSRLPFERRVIARGVGRPRVLVGRDISTTGLLVDSAEGLSQGDRLELAVHLGAGSTPLVVGATVVRSTDEGGAALSFVDLSETQRRYLEKMVDTLGVPGELVVSQWALAQEPSEAPPTH